MGKRVICANCGKKVKSGQRFCSNCGTAIEIDLEIKEHMVIKKKRNILILISMAIAFIATSSIVLVLYLNQCKHEFTEVTCTQLATCTKCGETKGELLKHQWIEATCEAAETCSLCNKTKGDPLGHNYEEATCTQSATCTRCGETKGEPLGHNYEGTTCTDDGVCTRCGEITKAAGHSWKSATCTTAKNCSVCGIEDGIALGHSGDEKCSRCGYIDKSVAIENAKNSIYVYGIDLKMNSVGGVDTYITWKNVSTKEIKYIHFYVQYYNSVKDVLRNEIGGDTTTKLSSTGPFPYGKGNYDYYSCSGDSAESVYFSISSGFNNDRENGWAGKYWEAPFYNTTTKYIKMSKVEIEYMNGSSYTISDLDAVVAIIGSGSHPNAWSTDDTGDDYLR
ncbi:MAG: zinc ribbon domain-containing protein [Lachnospiraceae bacterium]|nr:zinc ribbon domain-containing protein [Lachnospiraceae bacterium]